MAINGHKNGGIFKINGHKNGGNNARPLMAINGYATVDISVVVRLSLNVYKISLCSCDNQTNWAEVAGKKKETRK